MKAKRSFIPVEESFAKWLKDPEFRAAYEALALEFAAASAAIRASDGIPEPVHSGRT
jgi:hypothetical protein